jgi:hypothetical protein
MGTARLGNGFAPPGQVDAAPALGRSPVACRGEVRLGRGEAAGGVQDWPAGLGREGFGCRPPRGLAGDGGPAPVPSSRITPGVASLAVTGTGRDGKIALPGGADLVDNGDSFAMVRGSGPSACRRETLVAGLNQEGGLGS